ncbi:MAG: hypothetical protein HY270_23540 [Deltaproteobacteria bacterium]|nr:hypothetical protein [Deltaproteobacteria bacterium]
MLKQHRLLFFVCLFGFSGTALAFNTQNPRWEAPQHEMHKQHKPYRPLHAPPESLPPRPNAGRHASGVLAPRALASVATIIVVGVLAEWVAWTTGLSSTLLLFAAGLLAGPALGWLLPDRLFGNLLVPAIALGTAVLLFRAGLSLQLRSLRLPGPFLSPTLLAVWALAAGLAALILRDSAPTALTLAAIVVMTLPPVLFSLRQDPDDGTKHSGYDAPALECAGAFLAIVVFEAVLGGGGRAAAAPALRGMGSGLLAGCLGGWLAARLTSQLLQSPAVPANFQAPLTYAVLIAAFTLASFAAEESGLLTAVVMGGCLARNERNDITNLRRSVSGTSLLLAPVLLLVVAARLHGSDIMLAGIPALLFAAAVGGLLRPAGVLLSTATLQLSWRDRGWLTVMSPNGVAAAALATILGLRLWEIGYGDAAAMPVAVILVLVLAHSVAAVAALLTRERETATATAATSSSDTART